MGPLAEGHTLGTDAAGTSGRGTGVVQGHPGCPVTWTPSPGRRLQLSLRPGLCSLLPCPITPRCFSVPHYHSHQGTHSAALFVPWCLVDAQFVSVERMNEDVIAKPRSTASWAVFYRPQYPIRDEKGCPAALTWPGDLSPGASDSLVNFVSAVIPDVAGVPALGNVGTFG